MEDKSDPFCPFHFLSDLDFQSSKITGWSFSLQPLLCSRSPKSLEIHTSKVVSDHFPPPTVGLCLPIYRSGQTWQRHWPQVTRNFPQSCIPKKQRIKAHNKAEISTLVFSVGTTKFSILRYEKLKNKKEQAATTCELWTNKGLGRRIRDGPEPR